MTHGMTLRNMIARRPNALLCIVGAALTSAASAGSPPPCDHWTPVPTPNPGNHVNRLTSVSAIAPDDAWAAGHWRNSPVGAGPIAQHWDGSDWSIVALPDTSAIGAQPEIAGVEFAPNGDVWFVGGVITPYPTDNMPLILRRGNGDWDLVETFELRPQTVYPFAARGGRLFEAHAISDSDIWAVGQATGYGDASATSVPLAAHWDGSGWTDVPVPLVANRHHELTDVYAIASDDVWAVGDYRNIGGLFHGVTYHWDGNQWSHVPSPIEALPDSGIEEIVASGPDDVWAIGSGGGAVRVMRWNGDEWISMPAPPNYGGSLAALAPDNVWASGWNGFWHWNGVEWCEVASSVPNATYVIRGGGMEIISNHDIWCVGFSTLADGITSSSLAERLAATGAFAGDANNDGAVNVDDLNMVLGHFGTTVTPGTGGDLTQDGAVDVDDLNLVLADFGSSC